MQYNYCTISFLVSCDMSQYS